MARLQKEKAEDYEKVESKLLRKYRLPAESFPQKFCEAERAKRESFSEFASKLRANECFRSDQLFLEKGLVFEEFTKTPVNERAAESAAAGSPSADAEIAQTVTISYDKVVTNASVRTTDPAEADEVAAALAFATPEAKTVMTLAHKLTTLLALGTYEALTKPPPNIIFIFADDLGWDDVSFHGSAQIPTPNLDALAADGIILNNYYAQPLCTPSRAALLTGMYPIHTGMQQFVILVAEPWGLPLDVKLLPEYLRELDYETHLVGKWHLGWFSRNYTPTRRGFDTFYGFYSGEMDYYNHTAIEHGHVGLDFWIGTEPLRNETGRYSTTLFTERAINLIHGRNKTKPFFLFLSHQAVHAGSVVPFEAPQENIRKFPYIGEENRTIFAGMVDALDQSVGAVMEALYEAQMLDNSIVVFSSDNGGSPFGFHATRSFNWPLRGSKGTHWEGGTRAAAFIWSPLLRKRRRVSHQMMHITDWLPTLYHAAGGHKERLEGRLDGYNMWDVLSRNLSSPRIEVLYNIEPQQSTAALRYYDYKLVEGVSFGGVWDDRFPTPGGKRPHADLDELMANSTVARVLRGFYNVGALEFPPSWRLDATLRCNEDGSNGTNFVPGKPPYLFDVAKDPCELHNLAPSSPELLDKLQKRLDSYRKSAVAPRNKDADPLGFPECDRETWGPWVDPPNDSQKL
ncbi:arylsulfatase B-like [Haemaphysalis longicornis]